MIRSGTVVKNKKAFFNYQILDRFEAGISLFGHEVKAIRNSQINISDSFVRLENGEAVLWNAEISGYKFLSDEEYDPKRSRKLLLKKQEIFQIESKVKTGNLTVVPLSVYIVRGKIKVEVALAKGLKKREKQKRVKERDLERELHIEKRKYMVE